MYSIEKLYQSKRFQRNNRRVDGCGLLGIDSAVPQEWTEPQDEPRRLVDADELLRHAYEVTGEHGSEAVVPVRCIMDAARIDGR